MSRRRPTLQRLWPSLSMATSAMEPNLGAAAPYAHKRLAALLAFSPFLVPSFGAPKCNPSKNRERGGISALGGRRLNILQRNNQLKVRDHGGGDIWEGARPGRNVGG